MEKIFEIANLLIVWCVLIYFLREPFLEAIKNYILSEKKDRASAEEIFFSSKNKEKELTQFKEMINSFEEFVTTNQSMGAFDTYPVYSSSKAFDVASQLTLESQILSTLSKY